MATELYLGNMKDLKLSVQIDPSARTVDIEFLDGPTIPTLNRAQAYALLEALNEALPHMATAFIP
jgi:hypothetical protein